MAIVNNIFFLLSFFWSNLTLFNKIFILVDLPSSKLSASNLYFERNLFLIDDTQDSDAANKHNSGLSTPQSTKTKQQVNNIQIDDLITL